MFFVRLLSRLPFPVLYAISDFLFFISYRVVRYRRKMVWKNLVNSFPEKNEPELRKIEKEFFKNLCDYAVEMLKVVTISKEELGRRMRFTSLEIARKYADRKQPVIMLASHQFNWEWLLTSACFNLPMSVDFVYQPVNSEFFNRLSLEIRTRFGAHPIRRDAVARETARRKTVVRAIAVVADQYPGYDRDKKYYTTFLNQDTVFFGGAGQLAVLMQYPVIYYTVRKIKRGYYEAVAAEISDPPYAKGSDDMMERYVREVERVIREYPPGWLWSHNRWKTRHIKQDGTENPGNS